MKEKFSELSGCQVNEISDIGIRMRVLAGEIFSALTNLEWLKRQIFPQTAENFQLDLHAQQRGLTRKKATKSTGTLKFMRTSPLDYDITIPQNTTCIALNCEGISNQPLRFETTQEATLKAGQLEVSVSAESQDSGAKMNVAPKTITIMSDPPAGISAVINLKEFTGGTDAEDDSQLRARLLHSYKNIPNGTNCAFYKNIALKHEGIHSVSVLPRERGRGTVDIYVAAQGSVPQPEIVQAIQKEITDLREINVDVQVHAATLLNITLNVEIEIKPDYTFSDVKETCENAVKGYFYSLKIGEDVRICAVGNAIFSIDGVYNYSFLGGLTLDKSVDKKQLAVLKALSITLK
jgi:uncharacterized phage protein gp47/JayE